MHVYVHYVYIYIYAHTHTYIYIYTKVHIIFCEPASRPIQLKFFFEVYPF